MSVGQFTVSEIAWFQRLIPGTIDYLKRVSMYSRFAVIIVLVLCAFVSYAFTNLPLQEDDGSPFDESEKLYLRRRRAVISGILFFIPAFFLSLPFTITWAQHHWPGDGQAVLGAFWPSVGIAVISAICRCTYLLMKANLDSTSKRNLR